MKFSMTRLLVYKREALGTECVGNNYHTGQTGQSTSSNTEWVKYNLLAFHSWMLLQASPINLQEEFWIQKLEIHLLSAQHNVCVSKKPLHINSS
jgi:hypothetical protein